MDILDKSDKKKDGGNTKKTTTNSGNEQGKTKGVRVRHKAKFAEGNSWRCYAIPVVYKPVQM